LKRSIVSFPILWILLPVFLRIPRHEILDEQRDVSAPLTKRRHMDGEHIQAVEQILTETALRNRRIQIPVVAASNAYINRDGSEPPIRSNVRSWSARKSATWVSGGNSPISSKKSVPPSADSNRPIRR